LVSCFFGDLVFLLGGSRCLGAAFDGRTREGESTDGTHGTNGDRSHKSRRLTAPTASAAESALLPLQGHLERCLACEADSVGTVLKISRLFRGNKPSIGRLLPSASQARQRSTSWRAPVVQMPRP